MEFGERTQDCSPGHTAKEGPHLVRTGASRGYSRAAAPVWCCSRGIMGSSGSLSCGAREVRFLCAQHYIPPSDPSFGMVVESVETDAFKTIPSALAAKIYKLVIDYSDDDFVDGAIVSLPTTGNTFGGFVAATNSTSNDGLIEVKNLTPGAKVAAISATSFAESVYKTVSLSVPSEKMGKYSQAAGWKNFYKIKDLGGHLLGNMNTDTRLTTADCSSLLLLVKSHATTFPAYADINGDGRLTTADCTALLLMVKRK